MQVVPLPVGPLFLAPAMLPRELETFVNFRMDEETGRDRASTIASCLGVLPFLVTRSSRSSFDINIASGLNHASTRSLLVDGGMKLELRGPI